MSMTPAKHRKSRISSRIFDKIEIVTRLVYWGQEKLFEEKNQRWKIWWHCPFKSKWIFSSNLYENVYWFAWFDPKPLVLLSSNLIGWKLPMLFKGLPKAANIHMDRSLKKPLHTVWENPRQIMYLSAFWKPVYVTISGFPKPFNDSISGFQ